MQMQIFKNQEFGKVRVIQNNDEFWFVGADVAKNLGYSNTRKALIDHVDDEDKNSVTIRDGIAGNPNKVIINESGLYSLIPSALYSVPAFRRVHGQRFSRQTRGAWEPSTR